MFSSSFSYSVKTDLLTGGAMSRLYIANANRYDTGNYTCALADIAQATVAVHVLNGNCDVNTFLPNSCMNYSGISFFCCLSVCMHDDILFFYIVVHYR